MRSVTLSPAFTAAVLLQSSHDSLSVSATPAYTTKPMALKSCIVSQPLSLISSRSLASNARAQEILIEGRGLVKFVAHLKDDEFEFIDP
ncbi:hypothetical protein Bca52824_093602 [Brassica carinata]|uniref:Uncharacterized protein n=1 Tax=Brassica carinata TaxID=52824 RepID=A0A8X7P3P8_BRACI|nr:hypothetical protein Bca52824_093602 [Brassica carinata]